MIISIGCRVGDHKNCEFYFRGILTDEKHPCDCDCHKGEKFWRIMKDLLQREKD